MTTVPLLPAASVTDMRKNPVPRPIAGVIPSEPFHIVPEPLSTMLTSLPTGGSKRRVGVVPGIGGSDNCRPTISVTGLMFWMGGCLSSTSAAVGRVMSKTRSGPAGAPAKELPARSVAETRTAAVPVVAERSLTTKFAVKMVGDCWVRPMLMASLLPCGRMVKIGAATSGSLAVRVMPMFPGPAGKAPS